ncbi:MAG: hypothetical protein SO402_05055 [Prevotella sp.]|nr:hypothetical protein [Prevotella sp.]
MKKILMAIVALMTFTASANAMSYKQARREALFLTDKMAYELNLSDAQYDAAYEINLDYLMGVTSVDDVYGDYWTRRNLDLSYILLDWQWNAFRAASYFFRPLYWNAGCWHFVIYARYPRRSFYYFARPTVYVSYRGGHCWRMNGGHSYYHNHSSHFRNHHANNGMRDRFDRGEIGHSNRNNSNRFDRNNNGNGNRFDRNNNGNGNRFDRNNNGNGNRYGNDRFNRNSSTRVTVNNRQKEGNSYERQSEGYNPQRTQPQRYERQQQLQRNHQMQQPRMERQQRIENRSQMQRSENRSQMQRSPRFNDRGISGSKSQGERMQMKRL